MRGLLALMIVTVAAVGTGPVWASPGSSETPPTSQEAASGAPWAGLLVDVTAEVGLEFRHRNGMTGERFIHEILGGGGVLFDMDGDGDLDLYAVQGHRLGAAEKPQAGAEPERGDRLFRNDLTAAGPRFRDITERSGIDARGYGMGAVAADVDGDGWVDLYVLNWGANQLWRNRGDGTFDDATEKVGVGDPGWSTTASFIDADGDGRLDLFVGNYLEFDLARHKPCFSASGAPDYCGPASYPPAADRLYRQRNDGRFEDVTARFGLAGPKAAALGSIPLDADGDGRLELFVANDGMANHLWDWERGRFEEMALLAGCAVNGDGAAEASMGVDAGDVDGDGDEDLFMTHLDQETNTLYLNDGGFFEDGSDAAGVALSSFSSTGFGTRLIDLDLDGWLDAVVVNGAIKALEPLVRAKDPYPLHQPNHVLRNLGGGRFVEVSEKVGAAMGPSHVSRGLAAGDLDNDGDVDLIIFNNNGPLRVLENRVSGAGWIGVEAVRKDRVALGARVGVTAGDRTQWRRVGSGGSYASGQDPRQVFGLGAGAAPGAVRVRIEWPGGAVEQWPSLEPGRYHQLAAGTGQAVP
ncbi:MAG: CRTAC1 family protein [Acidobacteriota bacterium]